MEKITTTLRKYFNNNDICKPERPFENIIFIGKDNDVFGSRFTFCDCHFRNCEFKLYSVYGYSIAFFNCIFENCVFYEDSIFAAFTQCIFLNNLFPQGFRCTFYPATKFLFCKYDNSILEPLHKEMPCPASGEFVGWKKAYLCHRMSKDSNVACIIPIEVIVKLLIPSDSKRSSALSNKCRCEKAKVLEIQDMDGKKIDISQEYIVISMYEFKNNIQHLVLFDSVNKLQTLYIPGEMVYPNKFDIDPLVECGEGIQFFMTREEALNYSFY